jgi:integrase
VRLPNGYGSVHKLPGNRRRPWRARVTTGWTPEGKQLFYTVGYYATQREALAALAEYHEKPIGDRRDLTLGQIYEQWSEKAYETLDRSTVNGYKACWKRISKLADVPIRLLKTSDLQQIIDEMIKEGLGRSSLEKAKTLCGILMDIALNDDIIDKNYARAVKLPPARKPKKDAFTDMEVLQVERLAESGDMWAGTVMILIYTGMRGSEMCGLPRMRGDPPLAMICLPPLLMSTPHARGSTSPKTSLMLQWRVYPACAGIHPM